MAPSAASHAQQVMAQRRGGRPHLVLLYVCTYCSSKVFDLICAALGLFNSPTSASCNCTPRCTHLQAGLPFCPSFHIQLVTALTNIVRHRSSPAHSQSLHSHGQPCFPSSPANCSLPPEPSQHTTPPQLPLVPPTRLCATWTTWSAWPAPPSTAASTPSTSTTAAKWPPRTPPSSVRPL